MWILHTSDLHIDAGDIHTGRVLSDLGAWVDAQIPNNEKLDFFVVSGNVTRDGNPDSFAKAYELLAAFNRAHIRDPGPDAAGLPRIAVAPGALDCTGPDGAVSFANYHAFVERLCSAPAALHVNAKGVTLRELKTITLISVPYWDARNARAHQVALEELRDRVKALKLPDFHYAVATPTLLISHGFPAPSKAGAGHAVLDELHADCVRELGIELHLFGQGPATALLPERWGLGHVALSTGPKPRNQTWPFRANLLEINFRKGPVPQHGRARRDGKVSSDYPQRENAFMTNRVYNRLSLEKGGSSRSHIGGQLDLCFYRELPAEPNFSSFLARLAAHPDRRIVVYGLAGSGKVEFERQARGAARWGERDVFVVSRELRSYSDDKLTEEFIEDAKVALEKAPSGHLPVLLIREEGDARNDADARTSFLRGDGMEELARIDKLKVLILSRQPAHDETESLRMPSLTDHEVDNMLKSHGTDLPCRPEAFTQLAGGFFGFSRLLLDQVVADFNAMSPLAGVDGRTGTHLLDAALNSPSFVRHARSSVSPFTLLAGGDKVCEYIRRKAATHRQTIAGGLATLSVTETARDYPSHKPGSYKLVFKQLDQLGVVRSAGTPDEFQLLVPAPFLVPPAESNGSEKKVKLKDFPDRPDILLMTALPEELDAVLAQLSKQDVAERKYGEIYPFHRAWLPYKSEDGRSGRYSIVVSMTGKGRVEAMGATMTAIQRWKPSYVLLVGIAGGVESADVRIGDVLIPTAVMDDSLRKEREEGTQIRWEAYRVDPVLLAAARILRQKVPRLKAESHPEGDIPRVHFGIMITGDHVVARADVDEKNRETFVELVGREMEAGGVAAAVVRQPDTVPRFFMVRGCSDLANRNKDSPAVEGRREAACRVAAAYAIGLLETGPIVQAPATKEA